MGALKDLLLGSKKVAGLDIGSSLIKLIEIDDTPKGYALKSYAQAPLQRGVIENGLVHDLAKLTNTIKGLFKKSKCRVKNVATALSGHSVIIKKANFARMQDEELRELLTDEAENYMPFDDVSEINFDFFIIGENDLNPNQMDVMIVAAKKDIIHDCTSAVENAGRHVAIVDVDSFALEAAYEENYDFTEEDIVALVNIGASITNINIVKGGMSVFTRNFLLGGNAITEAVQKNLGVSFEEAEEAKLARGVPLNQEELIEYTQPVFAEIERSIDYFSSTFMDPYIKKILISGGCSHLPGIMEALTARTNCEVEKFNPFKNITYDKKIFRESYLENIGPTATLGVGLALRRIDDK
ncbi:MAG: type IV pilus assembly protein PilM [Deltaproteobacteria bacterium]|nr:type IV pilus assembly protein PilM [Deltaproteobacteria bacterium]